MAKKILIVINNLAMGGAERYAIQLANIISKNGDAVTLLTGTPLDLLNELNKSCAYKIFNTHPGKRFALIKYLLLLPIKIAQLLWIINKAKFDVIYSFLPVSGLPAWIAGKTLGIPVYYFPAHAFDVSTKFELYLHKSRLPNLLISKYVAGSEYLVKELLSDWGVSSADNIIYFGAGIDTQLFVPKIKTSNDFTIGCVSRLHPDKRIDLVIKSFAILRINYTTGDLRLVIAGDGEELIALKQLALELNIIEYVDFLGQINDSHKILPTFDLYIQTTKNPNIGLSAIEALSCGVPLIIAYSDLKEREMAVDTLKNYDAGWLVEAIPENIAKLVFEILCDPRQIELKKIQARKLAIDKYDLSSNLKLFVENTSI
jgi:glycosyltransferase involved in cell wall biosynthesis